jgi:glutamate decarboxylase
VTLRSWLIVGLVLLGLWEVVPVCRDLVWFGGRVLLLGTAGAFVPFVASLVLGVGTIGSSEAIMLGLLAHKWSWRDRRQAQGLPTDKPNVVFGAETHVVWDKFAKYFDVEMRKIPMRPDRYVLSVEDVADRIDENTIAVGAVLGTTHIGEADPISELNDYLVEVKNTRGLDIPIHVDGASGAFIAPFAEPDLEFDFRLEQVASINASGHKYGLVYPGVGWLVFRDRSYLPEELIFNVNYLGGAQPTYTFNFSRGSAMIQAQLYNFLRLGRSGYEGIVANMLANARHLNEQLEASGRFEILNPGLAEPVVTFKFKDDPGFDVYHLSARLRENGWVVAAYSLPPDAEDVHLMRVVVRIDLSRQMVDVLLHDIDTAWDELSSEVSGPRRSTKADLWTAPAHAAGQSKRRHAPS